MPRLSSRIQTAAFGSRNPANAGRTIAPAVIHKGPSMPVELFADEQLDPGTRRALLAIQQNVRQAFSQSRSSPLSYANLIQGVTLTNGGANGASPNIVAHGLDVAPSGYVICCTSGGYVTAHAKIAPAANDSKHTIKIWTQFTAFAGVTAVTADLLVYA